MRNVFKNLSLNGDLTDIVCENGKISKIGKVNEDGIDFNGKSVYAGLVDIHTHGGNGFEALDCELEKLSRFEAKNGITAFYPTASTASHERIVKLLETDTKNVSGAEICGIHLEGPYLNKNYIGAQDSNHVRVPDINEFSAYDNVKIVTLAPEINGAEEYIEKSKAVICLGHTEADYDTACRAFDKGAKCTTHTFNAMPALHHRQPSVVGAAFDKKAYVQLICDGIHIHPSIVRIMYQLFTSERLIFISDSIIAAGLCDGEYKSGGLDIVVKDKVARLKDGKTIAGSAYTLFDCVKSAISFGIPKDEAFKMASETPAKLMGLNKGVIKEGYDCDLIVVNDDITLDTVIIKGKLFEEPENE